jgi:hypothetical protein
MPTPGPWTSAFRSRYVCRRCSPSTTTRHAAHAAGRSRLGTGRPFIACAADTKCSSFTASDPNHLWRSRGRAYACDVTLQDASRRSIVLGLALALLAWGAATRSTAESRVDTSSSSVAVAIESVPRMLVTTSDRPVLSAHSRLEERQRGLGLSTLDVSNIGASALVSASVRLSSSVFSAGPVAQGLAGRGPPSFGNV